MSQRELIKVYIVHQDRIWREAVVRSLTRFRDISVLAETAEHDDTAWLPSPQSTQPAVVLLDLDLPSRSGLARTRQLLCCQPQLRVLMTGIPNDDSEVIAAIEAGAAGYMTYQSGFDDLISNIRALAADRTLCSQRIARLLFSRVAKTARTMTASQRQPVDDIHLTPRELQIMTLIEEGLSNKGIARRLSIEQQTVKNHVHHILVKLSLRRRTEVARYVRQHGLTRPVQAPGQQALAPGS